MQRLLESAQYPPFHMSELASALGTIEMKAGKVRAGRRLIESSSAARGEFDRPGGLALSQTPSPSLFLLKQTLNHLRLTPGRLVALRNGTWLFQKFEVGIMTSRSLADQRFWDRILLRWS